jgi:hypothetical protein
MSVAAAAAKVGMRVLAGNWNIVFSFFEREPSSTRTCAAAVVAVELGNHFVGALVQKRERHAEHIAPGLDHD